MITAQTTILKGAETRFAIATWDAGRCPSWVIQCGASLAHAPAFVGCCSKTGHAIASQRHDASCHSRHFASQHIRRDSTALINLKAPSLMCATPLVQDDPCSGRAIQKSLEVEAGKLIISVLANMRGEGSHCSSVTGFHFGKRF
jgi:hypothetical protein